MVCHISHPLVVKENATIQCIYSGMSDNFGGGVFTCASADSD
jgi:hypothetical protein